jgi:hypothetical protein
MNGSVASSELQSYLREMNTQVALNNGAILSRQTSELLCLQHLWEMRRAGGVSNSSTVWGNAISCAKIEEWRETFRKLRGKNATNVFFKIPTVLKSLQHQYRTILNFY